MDESTNFSIKQAQNQPVYVVSSKNKKIGLFLLTGPFAGLMAVLFINGIVTYISTTPGGPVENVSVGINLIELVLGFIGIICVIGILVGIPVGIVFLNKKELADGNKFDERSGKKEAFAIPNEIKGWNWGAAGLNWVWGIYHGVWISLLMFVPIVNLFWWIILGVKGNEWAWQSRKWESVEKFVSSQNKWKPWGIAFLAIGLLLGILGGLLE